MATTSVLCCCMATKLAVHIATERLISDMTERGWNAIDLARQADISDMTVYRILDGKSTTARTLKKIAKALRKPTRDYMRAVGEIPTEAAAS